MCVKGVRDDDGEDDDDDYDNYDLHDYFFDHNNFPITSN
jgi:hypothetical protein